jgi:hypothetical protein
MVHGKVLPHWYFLPFTSTGTGEPQLQQFVTTALYTQEGHFTPPHVADNVRVYVPFSTGVKLPVILPVPVPVLITVVPSVISHEMSAWHFLLFELHWYELEKLNG